MNKLNNNKPMLLIIGLAVATIVVVIVCVLTIKVLSVDTGHNASDITTDVDDMMR